MSHRPRQHGKVHTGRVANGVTVIEWWDGREVEQSADLAAVLAEPRSLVWVDLAGADVQVLDRLAEEMGLSPHAVEDALTPRERPKLSWHEGHTFVTCYAGELSLSPAAARHRSRLDLHQISAFLLPHGLLTVRPDGRFDMGEVVQVWRDRPGMVAAGPAGLVHGLLDVVVDRNFDVISQLDDVAEDLEEQLFADRPGDTRVMQQNLYRLHKELAQLRREVLPLREVVAGLSRHHANTPVLASEYADLYDHVIRASEWAESLRDMVTALYETHLALLDSRLNTVMKKLAGWAAVVAVPTAITGWFGQNIPFPGSGNAVGLALATVLIVVVTGGVYLTLRRHDWI